MLCSFLALLLACSSGASALEAAEACAAETSISFLQADVKKLAARKRKALEAETSTRPWEHHLYLVGTRHKAGSQLLRNTMHRTFDMLGANLSCQEHESQNAGSVITSTGGEHKCYEEPEIPIHWDNSLTKQSLQRNRALAGEKGMRAVQIIRDPLQMVASAYCYHHRGMEIGSPHAPLNIMELGYDEGVPAIARTMLPVITQMVGAYSVSHDGDVYSVRFENLTRSSEDFDSNIAEMFDFLFGDHITSEEMKAIQTEAQKEDLNRGENGFSAGESHTSEDDDMAKATEALHLIGDEFFGLYQGYQRELGYPVTPRQA